MQFNTLKDLYINQLRDLYSAETQLLKALPKMAKAAHTPELKAAFEEHLEETRNQVERLTKVFGELEVSPQGHTCEAMKGLIAEGEEVIKATGDPVVRDAALIASAQRVEHYEIAGYSTVRNFAKHLKFGEAASLLQMTLDEEGNADDKLTKLAEGSLFTKGINDKIMA